MNNTNPENNRTEHSKSPMQRRSAISRLIAFLGLGHTTEEKRQIYAAQFRHPSFRSTIPGSPEGIDDIKDKNTPED